MTDTEKNAPDEKSAETSSANDFSAEAEEERLGIIEELKDLILHNKKWWLIPILVVIGLLSILVLLTQTAVAPFIYTIW